MGADWSRKTFWMALLLLVLADTLALVVAAILIRYSAWLRENQPGHPSRD